MTDRVAAVSCSNCGRFLCSFCRIEWSGEDLCVTCVEALRQPDKSVALESSRFHFDSLALALAIVPSLLVFPSLFTAPLALGLALVTIRRSCSITPRSKWRFVVAMLVSLAVIGAWAWLFDLLGQPGTGKDALGCPESAISNLSAARRTAMAAVAVR